MILYLQYFTCNGVFLHWSTFTEEQPKIYAQSINQSINQRKHQTQRRFEINETSLNLSLAVVFPGVSGGEHHHLSFSRCAASSSHCVSSAAAGWSCSASLRLRTERLKVQGFVLEGSFDAAEHPSILHPRTRRVGT